jgi:hypothetical protein
MKIIINKKLNFGAMLEIIHQIYECQSNEICIDFSNVERAYPNGIVPLICEISYQRRNVGKRISIIPPKGEQIQEIFHSNGWWAYLFEDEVPADHKGGSTIPLYAYGNNSDLNEAINRIVDILARRTQMSKGVHHAFEWTINEIAGNVLTHSAAKCGWIQSVNFKENNTISMVVVDRGVGIPFTMRRGFKLDTDVSCIMKSLEKGVTSDPENGQGNGLAGALSITQANQSDLRIVSGRGYVHVEKGEIHGEKIHSAFKGTYVEFQIRTDSEIDLPSVLWGHTPLGRFDLKYETEGPDMWIKLRDEMQTFGNRQTGLEIRQLLINVSKANPGTKIVIDFDGVGLVSSSFADEVFGKLFVAIGPVDFSKVYTLHNLTEINRSIVNMSIMQRMAQMVGNVTKVK